MFIVVLIGLAASCKKDSADKPDPKPTVYDEEMRWKGLQAYEIGGKKDTITAAVNTNVDFTVAIEGANGEECNWVTYVPPTRSVDKPAEDKSVSFVIDAFEHSAEENRKAIVTISANGLTDQAFVIIQIPLVQLRLEVKADNTRFTHEGGTMTVDIDATSDYKIATDADWIVPNDGNPASGSGKATFTISANQVKSDREGTVTFTTEGLEPKSITVHQDPYSSNIGIKTVQDLLEFVEASNNGDYQTHDLSKWVNEDGEICLLADLDLSSIKEWTPIGNPGDLTLVGNYSISADTVRIFGRRYNSGNGVFNGNGHTISGLHLVANDNSTNKGYTGFFGALYNATVKNLTFDNTCTLEVNTTQDAGCAYGFLTSSAIACRIENIKVYGTVKSSVRNHADYTRVFVGGIVGYLCANGDHGDCVMTNCEFNGKFEGFKSNTVANSTEHCVGGLVGFSRGDYTVSPEHPMGDASKTVRVRIEDCTNRTDLYGEICKVGGIVGVTRDGSIIRNCKNYGKVMIKAYDFLRNAETSYGRAGGIVAYDNDAIGSVIENCENYGDIINRDGKSVVGGIVSVIAQGGSYNGNMSNCTVCSPSGITRGIFVGNVNNANAKFSGNKAKGKIADRYVDGEFHDIVEITKENFSTYVGKNGKEAPTFSTGVLFWE